MKVVIQNPENPSDCKDAAYTEPGVLVNSEEFSGMENEKAKKLLRKKQLTEDTENLKHNTGFVTGLSQDRDTGVHLFR